MIQEVSCKERNEYDNEQRVGVSTCTEFVVVVKMQRRAFFPFFSYVLIACTHLRPCSADIPLHGEVAAANVMDGIDTHAIGFDDATNKFGISTCFRHDVVILLERAVSACKDLVEMTRLMIAGRLVEDLS